PRRLTSGRLRSRAGRRPRQRRRTTATAPRDSHPAVGAPTAAPRWATPEQNGPSAVAHPGTTTRPDRRRDATATTATPVAGR
ncbi:hypothetical protein, partial [Occultella aeris]|uniref:hypothetical protein n=1 Tax=Occultella aeris TaxID=2761496 RepID=UPI003B43CFBE